MLVIRSLTHTALLLAASLALTVSARAVEPDALIPADSDSVVVVNLRQALDAPLVKKYALDLLKGLVESNPDIQNLAKGTGLDVGKDIDSLTLTSAGGLDGKMLVVARGKFDVPKFETTLANYAKTTPKALKISKEGSATIYESTNEGKPTFAAFANAKTLLASPDRAYLTAALQRRTVPLKKELAEVLAQSSGKESVYLAMIVTDDVKKSLENNDQTKELAKILKTVTAAVTLTDALQIDVAATTANPQGAQQLALALNTYKQAMPGLFKAIGNEQLIPLGEALSKNLKVNAQGNSTTLSLTVTEDVIKKALGM